MKEKKEDYELKKMMLYGYISTAESVVSMHIYCTIYCIFILMIQYIDYIIKITKNI